MNESTLTNQPPEITIFLTPPEAVLFKDFQQYHQTFTLLCQKGVFGIKGGSATIHFDEYGNIGDIERHDKLYSARLNKKLSTS